MSDPQVVSWLAIDDQGQTHHVTPDEVMEADEIRRKVCRVFHEVICQLADHKDPDVRRLIVWACAEIQGEPTPAPAPEIAPQINKNTPTSPRKPPRVLVVAFGLLALLGAFTAANLLISWMSSH